MGKMGCDVSSVGPPYWVLFRVDAQRLEHGTRPGGLPRQSNDSSPGVLDLLLCLLCGSSVIMPTVVVFLAHILHVTHQLSVRIQPFMPRLVWFIQRTWHIVPLPDALVLLRQSFPGEKIPMRQLT